MKSYSRILHAVHSMAWAIQPEKLQAIIGFLELQAHGIRPTAQTKEQIHAASLEASARAQQNSNPGNGSVAVLPLFGLIMHRANMMGDISSPSGTSTDKFLGQFRRAVDDPSVKAIVIDIDSPGGTVDGVPELSAEIFRARNKKPITAVSDCLTASAAYWIGCSATELVVSPSSGTGSIGVYTSHEDDSKMLSDTGVTVTLISAGKYKTEGNNYEPLGDEARGAMQAMVDDYYGMFVRDVARGRGVKADDVRGGFGQGRVVTAQQAVQLGMADRVATLDQVLGKLGVSRGSGSTVSMAATGKPSLMNAAAFPNAQKADLEEEDCTCLCGPCSEEDDCLNCDHDGCDCKGCKCESALESASAKKKKTKADADAQAVISASDARKRRIQIATF